MFFRKLFYYFQAIVSSSSWSTIIDMSNNEGTKSTKRAISDDDVRVSSCTLSTVKMDGPKSVINGLSLDHTLVASVMTGTICLGDDIRKTGTTSQDTVLFRKIVSAIDGSTYETDFATFEDIFPAEVYDPIFPPGTEIEPLLWIGHGQQHPQYNSQADRLGSIRKLENSRGGYFDLGTVGVAAVIAGLGGGLIFLSPFIATIAFPAIFFWWVMACWPLANFFIYGSFVQWWCIVRYPFFKVYKIKYFLGGNIECHQLRFC